MTETPQPQPANPGLFQRIIGVITSPTATFGQVVENPRPAGVLLVVAVIISLATGLPQFTEAGRQAALQMNVSTMERFTGQPVSDEAYAQMESRSHYGGYFAIGGSFVGLPVVALLITALLWVVFNTILGGTASFKQVLAVQTHSQVIGALGALVGAPIQLAQGTVSVGGPFNLGALASFLPENSPWAAFLSAVSVFSLWGIVVTAIGLAVLYKRKSRNIAIGLLVAYVALTAAFTVGLSGLMGRS
jgi:hypothetical protein